MKGGKGRGGGGEWLMMSLFALQQEITVGDDRHGDEASQWVLDDDDDSNGDGGVAHTQKAGQG